MVSAGPINTTFQAKKLSGLLSSTENPKSSFFLSSGNGYTFVFSLESFNSKYQFFTFHNNNNNNILSNIIGIKDIVYCL